MLKLIISAALCLASFNGEWKTYSKDNYSISHPSDWEIMEKAGGSTIFSCIAPMESDTDNFRENIGLVTESLASQPNISLKEYAEASEKGIKSFITNFKSFEREMVKGKDNEYFRMRYSGQQGQYNIMITQHLYIQKKTAYVLTFVTMLDKYEHFKEDGKKIMESFVVK